MRSLALKEYKFDGFQILRSEGGQQLTKSAKRRERRKQAKKAVVDATSKLFFRYLQSSCIIGVDLLDHAGGTSDPDLSPSVTVESVCTLCALRRFHLISNLGSPRKSRAEVDKALEDIRAENKKMRMDLDQQVAWCRTEHSDILGRTNEVEGWVLGRQVCFLTIIFT